MTINIIMIVSLLNYTPFYNLILTILKHLKFYSTGVLNFGAIVWSTTMFVKHDNFARLPDQYTSAWICLILAGAGNLLNFVIGCYQVMESGRRPKDISDEPAYEIVCLRLNS